MNLRSPLRIIFLTVFSLQFVFTRAQQDTIGTIKIRTKCKCHIDAVDTLQGRSSINVNLQFEKNLSLSDFECYGFKLLKNNSVIACITNHDSLPFNFLQLTPGMYNVQFFADGYQWKNNTIKLKPDDIQTDYFLVGFKQLPKYLQWEIKKRRRRKWNSQ